jgi:hypothetical protein
MILEQEGASEGVSSPHEPVRKKVPEFSEALYTGMIGSLEQLSLRMSNAPVTSLMFKQILVQMGKKHMRRCEKRQPGSL